MPPEMPSSSKFSNRPMVRLHKMIEGYKCMIGLLPTSHYKTTHTHTHTMTGKVQKAEYQQEEPFTLSVKNSI